MGQQYRAMTGCNSIGLQQGTMTQNETSDNDFGQRHRTLTWDSDSHNEGYQHYYHEGKDISGPLWNPL